MVIYMSRYAYSLKYQSEYLMGEKVVYRRAECNFSEAINTT